MVSPLLVPVTVSTVHAITARRASHERRRRPFASARAAGTLRIGVTVPVGGAERTITDNQQAKVRETRSFAAISVRPDNHIIRRSISTVEHHDDTLVPAGGAALDR